MNEPMTDKQIRGGSRRLIREMQEIADALHVINDHGDLCKDGARTVSNIVLLMRHLVETIEKNGEVKPIADAVGATAQRL